MPVQQTFRTVNGENINVLGRVQLAIDLSSISFVVQFIVCDNESDCIVGQDFLSENVDSISYRRSCLTVGSKTIPLWMGGTALQICRVEVRNTTKIPAHSRAWIPVNIPFSEHLGPTGFIEPSFDLISKNGFCAVGGIIDVSNSDAKVSVINFGSKPATLNAKTA